MNMARFNWMFQGSTVYRTYLICFCAEMEGSRWRGLESWTFNLSQDRHLTNWMVIDLIMSTSLLYQLSWSGTYIIWQLNSSLYLLMCFIFSFLIKSVSLLFLLLICLFSLISSSFCSFLNFLRFFVLSEFFFIKLPESSPLTFHQGIEDDGQ